MSWISPWALFLGGIDSAIYNTKNKIKSPFRLKLKEKYAKKYNETDLFQRFSSCSDNIVLQSRHWHYMYGGNGLFLTHLIKEYQNQNIKVKIVMLGNREEISHYFVKQLGYTVTDLDGKDDNFQETFNRSLKDFNNVLSVRTDVSYSKEYRKKQSYITQMVDEIIKRRENGVVYLVTNLFVEKNDEDYILKLSEEDHVKLVYFDIDFPNFRLATNSINVLFPHYESNNLSAGNFNRLTEAFPAVPPKMIQKYYYPYNHFVYEWNGTSGLFFMNNTEID